MQRVRISRGRGRVKIVHESTGMTILFEQVGKDALESRFDRDGSLTNQRLLKNGKAENAATAFLEDIGATETVTEEYTQIKLDKSCPHCAARPLTRYIDTLMYPQEAPVMPLYVCEGCKRRSYYLTDEYLKSLVTTNRQLFETAELAQMDKNEKAFLEELRAYIIRIFASKSIPNIK